MNTNARERLKPQFARKTTKPFTAISVGYPLILQGRQLYFLPPDTESSDSSTKKAKVYPSSPQRETQC